ncbi:MAG: undecaprenyl-diphosphate phosphatase [Gemmiger sp.]|uniref:undecaprenyl-diphosphate phosphatase n=1 Tax=Gemmiger sp. TaxID=2049027 RepID=UPI002E7A248D|nr:undecaprenyl-diphosphate phosphatase [Gemmiger sp.]MEE0799703.1 undecaprenyl-diphosphate phosphatase [Gemmiger sp.]
MNLFLEILKSVIYGVIEGITEWLPISSTGHMILAEQVLRFGFSEDFMEMFRVVIQLGAILAVVVLYFRKLWPFCRDNGRDTGLASHVRWPVLHLWFKILVACLPAAVLGLLLDDWMDEHLYNSVVVAAMLIVYGVAFILIERRPRVPTTTKLSRIRYSQALKVGGWQVLALIPGTSRSGSTILGGMLCGMSRPAASQFTFFLAIPVMAGASLLKLVKFFAKGNTFTMPEAVCLLVGCAVAFLVSIMAIRFLMEYVKQHTFTAFGVYRIALGVLVLVVWAVQSLLSGAPAGVPAAS